MGMRAIDRREPLADHVLMRAASPDEAEVAGAKLLSRHRVVPTERGRFEARINGASLGSVALYHMKYGPALTVIGPPPSGFLAVTIPLTGALSVEHRGRRFEAVAGRSAAVITSSAPMTLGWSTGLSMFCLRVDMSALRSFAQSLDPCADDDEIEFEPFIDDPAAAASVLGCAGLVQVAAEGLGRGTSWPAALATRLREHVMTTLLLAQPNSCRAGLTSGRRSVPRSAVREALEVIDAGTRRLVTPTVVARTIGVSVRVLQVGFREVLGTTPHAYILDARLRRARSDLVLAWGGDGATVNEIARRWGFGNVGRFAAQYRRMFGENPSETLRRR